MEDLNPDENIASLGVSNFRLCIDSQYWNIKTPNLPILSKDRVLHLDRLIEGTWLYSFGLNSSSRGVPLKSKLFFFHTKKTNFLSSVYTVICFKKNRQRIGVRSHLVFSSLKIFVIKRFCCYFLSAFKHFVFTVFSSL